MTVNVTELTKSVPDSEISKVVGYLIHSGFPENLASIVEKACGPRTDPMHMAVDLAVVAFLTTMLESMMKDEPPAGVEMINRMKHMIGRALEGKPPVEEPEAQA
jgi:hypothetical protein